MNAAYLLIASHMTRKAARRATTAALLHAALAGVMALGALLWRADVVAWAGVMLAVGHGIVRLRHVVLFEGAQTAIRGEIAKLSASASHEVTKARKP